MQPIRNNSYCDTRYKFILYPLRMRYSNCARIQTLQLQLQMEIMFQQFNIFSAQNENWQKQRQKLVIHTHVKNDYCNKSPWEESCTIYSIEVVLLFSIVCFCPFCEKSLSIKEIMGTEKPKNLNRTTEQMKWICIVAAKL